SVRPTADDGFPTSVRLAGRRHPGHRRCRPARRTAYGPCGRTGCATARRPIAEPPYAPADRFGTRRAPWLHSASMRQVVAVMSEQDMIAVAAYAASLRPQGATP